MTTELQARKRFGDRAARAALAGWQLWRSDPDDGPQRFFVGRWGMVRVLADLDEVDRFLDQVTTARAEHSGAGQSH